MKLFDTIYYTKEPIHEEEPNSIISWPAIY